MNKPEKWTPEREAHGGITNEGWDSPAKKPGGGTGCVRTEGGWD